MNAAVIEAIGDWGAELERALAADPGPDPVPLERFHAVWSRFIESFEAHRQLWAASLEVAGVVDRLPQVREDLAAALEQGRMRLAQVFQGIDPATDRELARAVGSFYQALISGMVVQWVIDPEHAPSSRELTEAFRTIIAAGSSRQPADRQRS